MSRITVELQHDGFGTYGYEVRGNNTDTGNVTEMTRAPEYNREEAIAQALIRVELLLQDLPTAETREYR